MDTISEYAGVTGLMMWGAIIWEFVRADAKAWFDNWLLNEMDKRKAKEGTTHQRAH